MKKQFLLYKPPLVSIVISSFNYGKYLKDCIDSALNQDYQFKEIIVIDDGSSDESPEIIKSYSDKIVSFLKFNKGQASVFNLGLSISSGEIICFVDSDDLLDYNVITMIVNEFNKPNTVKVHWPLRIINENGKPTGKVMHEYDLAEGNISQILLMEGPDGYNWPCTSGNAWSKIFLKNIFPISEKVFWKGPDTFISAFAPLFGEIRKIPIPKGSYRIHSKNNSFNTPIYKRIQDSIKRWNYTFDQLEAFCNKHKLAHNRINWENNSWWHKLEQSVNTIENIVESHASIILVDQEEWVVGGYLGNHKIYPFSETDGSYNGLPLDDQSAIKETQKLIAKNAQYLVIPWNSFWVAEIYPEWVASLNKPIFENFLIKIYRLPN